MSSTTTTSSVKQIIKDTTVQYSNKTNLITVQYSNLSDVINEAYIPWYDKHRRALGDKRFMELVAKARAGSDTPKVLLRWFLNNPELVR